nr:hypothetical protein [uncultured bacterium]
MNRIRKWTTKNRLKGLTSELEELITRAVALREGTPNQWSGFYEFLTETQQNRYSALAKEHFELSSSLGLTSEYFNPKRDAVRTEADSPIGLLTVQHDTSVAVQEWLSPLKDKHGERRQFLIKDGKLIYPNWVACHYGEHDEENVRTFYAIWKETSGTSKRVNS